MEVVEADVHGAISKPSVKSNGVRLLAAGCCFLFLSKRAKYEFLRSSNVSKYCSTKYTKQSAVLNIPNATPR